MEKQRTSILSFAGLSGMLGIFEASKKVTVIGLRWPVVITCAYLLVEPSAQWFSLTTVHFIALLYILSNAILGRFDEKLFESSYFYVPLVIFDTFILTTSLIISGRVGTDFYLTYFLIIILCSIWQDLVWSITIATCVSILYGYILFKTTDVFDTSLYIRFPFLFVASLFYGYFAQVVRGEKVLKEQAEIERWKAIANLAAGVAHEVKNPLAILLQAVEYVSRKIPAHDQDVSMVLVDMKDAVRRADSVIRGLLDFSSLTELTIVPENLNSIIDNSLLLLKNQFDRHRIVVTKELAPDLQQASVDRRRIEQVLVNLLVNAIEAMPQGGRLTVRTYNEMSKENKAMVIAQVENEGSSIPEDILPRIFDPFFTTKRSTGGTGLGLSVVKSIMDTHNGSIELRNRENGGVTVTLHFKT
jgi:signal transduction histidine kinase